MKIKKLTADTPAPKGKSPRVTMAVEPKIAEIIRDLAKREKLELSQFLEQATIAWVRKWRPEFDLVVEGPEGPSERTEIVALRDEPVLPTGRKSASKRRSVPRTAAKRRTSAKRTAKKRNKASKRSA